MPRAEVGTPKFIANQMKAKGLQRLRWYCQVCEKQCRDENGFKCHTQSESHIQKILNVGNNPKVKIEEFSKQFKHDFIFLLRTGHGEKSINVNRFYQEYIQNKEHIHMNATKWNSLTEFTKYLGREGICRVEETEEKGLCISWIDNSPEAIKRQEAIKRKERSEKGDEYRTMKELEAQIRLAKKEVGESKEELQTELKRDGSATPLTLKLTTGVTSTNDGPRTTNSTTTKAKISLSTKITPSTQRKNVFSTSSSKISKPATSTTKKPLNAFQKIMLQEQQRQKKPL